jgi:menaquinone-dependent protoporphyrinogen oxidase
MQHATDRPIDAAMCDAVRDYHCFSGEFYRERIGRVGAALWRLSGGRVGDFRNFSDVDEWAHGIARALAQTASSSYTSVRS